MTDPAMFKDLQDAKKAFVEAQKNYFLFPSGSLEKQEALRTMEKVVEFVLDHYKEKALEWISEIRNRYF